MGEFLFFSRSCEPSAFAIFPVAPCILHAAGKTKFPPIGREAQRSDPGGRAKLVQDSTERYVTPYAVLLHSKWLKESLCSQRIFGVNLLNAENNAEGKTREAARNQTFVGFL